MSLILMEDMSLSYTDSTMAADDLATHARSLGFRSHDIDVFFPV